MKLFVVFAICIVAGAIAAPNRARVHELGHAHAQEHAQKLGHEHAYEQNYEPEYTTKHVPAYASLYPEMELRRPHVPIESMSHETDHQGTYTHHHKSIDGHHMVQGTLKHLGGEEGPVSITKGSYSYPGPDGQQYTVHWTADENGFHATGDHLPTSPPIPEEIKQSIDRSALPADHHLVVSEHALHVKSHNLLASSHSAHGH